MINIVCTTTGKMVLVTRINRDYIPTTTTQLSVQVVDFLPTTTYSSLAFCHFGMVDASIARPKPIMVAAANSITTVIQVTSTTLLFLIHSRHKWKNSPLIVVITTNLVVCVIYIGTTAFLLGTECCKSVTTTAVLCFRVICVMTTTAQFRTIRCIFWSYITITT